jgi:hypothetical protein
MKNLHSFVTLNSMLFRSSMLGRVIAQAVSRRIPTAAARVRIHV